MTSWTFPGLGSIHSTPFRSNTHALHSHFTFLANSYNCVVTQFYAFTQSWDSSLSSMHSLITSHDPLLSYHVMHLPCIHSIHYVLHAGEGESGEYHVTLLSLFWLMSFCEATCESCYLSVLPEREWSNGTSEFDKVACMIPVIIIWYSY